MILLTEQICRYLRHKPLLRISVLLMTLAPTSMVWAPVLEVQRKKTSMLFFRNLYTSKRRSRKFLLLRIGCPAWIHISRKHFFATGLTEMEQNFSTLIARLCQVETYAASASSVSGSARSWPLLEQVDGSTAAGFPWPRII